MPFSPLCGLCSSDFEAERPYMADLLFGKMAALGFEATQFSLASVAEFDYRPDGRIEFPGVITPAAIRAVNAAAGKHNVKIRVINATFNMAHPDPEVRREGVRRFGPLCEAARELGAPFLSLCSGTRYAAHLWTASPDNGTEEAWNAMLDTMLRCTELAERYGLTLAIESEASNVISTPGRARRLMDTVKSERLKMILDAANLFHPGTAHPDRVKETLDHAFDVFGRDIVIAHGKDIREGDGIEFCGTGLGIVDFVHMARRLRELDFAGDMFLHGIYKEADMPRARAHWLAALEAAKK